MADPLSFVASVIAVATLAETVATKGYQYIKAVKDCPNEVRSLIAEVNVLCGVLGRLQILLSKSKSKRSGEFDIEGLRLEEDLDDPAGQERDEDSGASEESEGASDSDASQELDVPDFIYECQKTLLSVEAILNKFGRRKTEADHPPDTTSLFKSSRLRRLTPKDLVWPLRRSQTLDLIGALERHKSTCTLALAENSLRGSHAILEQTVLTNKYLADLKAKQEKILEISITHDQEKALQSLSPVNPALKLQEFRRERQRGTGTWLFDVAEMSHWLETPNSALWIYGIPGAGKTILSTLVVDEVLARKRSKSIGTAYFYVRHSDKASHVLSNVLGALISQLARQNPSALSDVVDAYEERLKAGSSATPFEDSDLLEQLQNICKYFTDSFIMIDGLDECGTVFDTDRKRLVETIAQLHRSRDCSVRVLIFSRDEFDIKRKFDEMEFKSVPIAATSADLRLFISAWLPSLEIQDEMLKTEIADRLVEEANGMFMWVRLQVDYLQRLPSDSEKRRALKRLPPTLKETYVRIFETIDDSYPVQTTKYIQRLLRWLVHGIRPLGKLPDGSVVDLFNTDVLRMAICVESQGRLIPKSSIPTLEQIFRWLGCLVTKRSDGAPQLSHFTIEEFLKSDSREIAKPNILKYLVTGDRSYVLNVCLTFIVHDSFANQACLRSDEVQSFLSKHPLFFYAAVSIHYYLQVVIPDGLNAETRNLLEQFLSTPTHPSFALWKSCADYTKTSVTKRSKASPLCFAVSAGLAEDVQRLLISGVDPNARDPMGDEEPYSNPLYLAIRSRDLWRSRSMSMWFGAALPNGQKSIARERSLHLTKLLVDSGSDVNRQLIEKIEARDIEGKNKTKKNEFDDGEPSDIDQHDVTLDTEQYLDITTAAIVTPFTLAIIYGFPQIASILLDVGASWDAIVDDDLISRCDEAFCSIRSLLRKSPTHWDVVQRVVDCGKHQDFEKAVDDLRLSSGTESSSESFVDGGSQEQFTQAYQIGDWHAVREILALRPDIEVNRNDENGENALYTTSAWDEEGTTLIYLLEHGADPNTLTSEGLSPLGRAAHAGNCEHISYLLRFGALIEQREPNGWTPLLAAVCNRQFQAVELLLQKGADVNAVLDSGAGALNLVTKDHDKDVFSLLMAQGIDLNKPDNYGTTVFHAACRDGFELGVTELIKATSKSETYLNDGSLIFGTPLYISAEGGYNNIITRLLDAGAEIDRVGPGCHLGSALMGACSRGHVDTVKVLLSRGASQKVQGCLFQSASGTARAFRKDAVLKVLDEHDAGSIQGHGESNPDSEWETNSDPESESEQRS
ncbi:hypothetical protein ACLMJK_009568 [Lecanora helva]